MTRNNSPYGASFTAASMMLSETIVVVSHLLKEDSPESVKELRDNPELLKIQSVSARSRVSIELVKRYRTMPESFWAEFLIESEEQQRLSLFMVLLKTYPLLLDFQLNLAIPKYNSVDRVLTSNDVLMRLNEIASKDEFVDTWTEQTRKKIASTYITILKQAGLMDSHTKELAPPSLTDEELSLFAKEIWFLQACFIPKYRIEIIKAAYDTHDSGTTL